MKFQYLQFRAEHCQNYRLYKKKCSNKSCRELNFVQKSQWANMPISTRNGATGSKVWYVSNIIYIVLKWKVLRFIFRLNTAEITDYFKKLFK